MFLEQCIYCPRGKTRIEWDLVIQFLVFLLPCLLRLASMWEEFPERLSMELEWVHWDRRDWGWGGSFMDSPPTSMQFTFMFGLSPAKREKTSNIEYTVQHKPDR